jgi:hypothetical protein
MRERGENASGPRFVNISATRCGRVGSRECDEMLSLYY